MKTNQRLRFWASVALVAVFCWSPAALAQHSKANPKTNNNAKTEKGASASRQSAREGVLAAAAARAQGDEQYRRYIDALNQHNQQVKAFVAARRGAR